MYFKCNPGIFIYYGICILLSEFISESYLNKSILFFKQMEKSLTYEKRKNCLIVYCETKKLYDFFNNISSVVEKDCFIIDKDKEQELIKILNYLNLTEKNGKPRFLNAIYNYSDDEEYSYSEDSSPSEESDFLSDNGDGEVNDFFKSFTHSDFIEKNENKMVSERKQNEITVPSLIRKKEEDEYSSSSYNSSSSDNFPSPKTPKRRNNYSNEQLYAMIEKLEKRMNLIQRVLEKKIL
jgi:hypothetical protein